MENNTNQKQLSGAILIAGLFIAGAILLKGNTPVEAPIPLGNAGEAVKVTNLKISPQDHILGDPKANVVIVEYGDFQCGFCKKFFKGSVTTIKENYIQTGKVAFIYRDYAFLGPESVRAAEAARCAGDQGKFYEYHDYLYNYENTGNQNSFVDANLKSFAKNLGLNQADFNTCLDSNKYAQAVANSMTEGTALGVRGTPKSFILKNGKVVDTIDGAEPSEMVIPKIEKALQ